jgi:hypothetical protein
MLGRFKGAIVAELIRQHSIYWEPNEHVAAPLKLRHTVRVMMTIRIVEHTPACVLSWLPNELMFLIFSFLPWNVHGLHFKQ